MYMGTSSMLQKGVEIDAYYVLSEARDHCISFCCLPYIELILLLTEVIKDQNYEGYTVNTYQYKYIIDILWCI